MAHLLHPAPSRLALRPIRSADELYDSGHGVDLLTLPHAEEDRYIVGFAGSRACVEEALRLRYEVFNLELGEGLGASHLTGMDEDQFDRQMTHLVLYDRQGERVVGTYRMQTIRRALAGCGIYSAQEYDLTPLTPIFDKAVETGRVCIDPEHRSLSNLRLLWSGLAAFLKLTNHQYFFGCCSITATDPDDGWRALRTIRQKGYLHADYFAKAQPACSCGDAARENDPALGDPLKLPRLFAAYVRMGASVVSEPAIDREFGTVDFLVLLNSSDLLG